MVDLYTYTYAIHQLIISIPGGEIVDVDTFVTDKCNELVTKIDYIHLRDSGCEGECNGNGFIYITPSTITRKAEELGYTTDRQLTLFINAVVNHENFHRNEFLPMDINELEKMINDATSIPYENREYEIRAEHHALQCVLKQARKNGWVSC